MIQSKAPTPHNGKNSERREVTLVLNRRFRIGSGGFSEVFRSTDGAKVFKLFISTKHPSNMGQDRTTPEHDEQARRTFSAECDAYAIAMNDASLRDHVPHFYGQARVTDVIDIDGTSLAELYLLDCCYALRHIQGEVTELGLLRGRIPDYVEEFIRRMKSAGISYTEDASVFMPEDRNQFKLIDFATRDVQGPILEM